MDFDWYVTKDKAHDKAYIDDSIAASEQVQQEDIWLCERVQRGLDSPHFRSGGRYAPSLEGGEYMFVSVPNLTCFVLSEKGNMCVQVSQAAVRRCHGGCGNCQLNLRGKH